MKFIYFLFSIPHILCFIIYRNIIPDIKSDLIRFSGQKAQTKDFIIQMRKKEYRNVFYYRLPFILRHILNLILRREQSCLLHTNSIGEGLFIQHGFSSIIVAQKIGKNFGFNQNVTVGWSKKGKPIIGDNVRIYTGAVVAGNIKIGNNVTISANSVVTIDVPDNSFVIGNPCTIYKKKNETFNNNTSI